MKTEIWKDIKGYEGLYQVSNLGNVKSLPREMIKGKRVYISKEKVLKPIECQKYFLVSLYKNDKGKQFKIHLLVAMAFLNYEPTTRKIVVDHINNEQLDNRLENLQIITSRENTSKDRVNKTSKYTGVSWAKKNNKWITHININGKRMHLGLFKCEYEAHLKYQETLKTLEL